MDSQKDSEQKRAGRIVIRVNEYHLLLSNIYENLVDRDFAKVERDARTLIMELRFIIKSMEDDDF